MNEGRFTRVAPVAAISTLGLCIGLAVTACSPTASNAADPTAVIRSTASAPAAQASSAPAATSTPTVAQTSSNATPVDSYTGKEPFVLWECNTSRPEVEPANYLLACGNGGDALTGVHWTSWTPTGATGIGTEHLDNCIPNCAGQAESKFVDYPVKISLAGSYLAAQDAPFAYAKITLTYVAARPLLYIEVNGKWEYTHPASWSPVLPERPASGH